MKSHINKIVKKCRSEITKSGGVHADNALVLLDKALVEIEVSLDGLKSEVEYNQEVADVACKRLKERSEAYDSLLFSY